jgi:hypothetical protein
MINRSGHTGTYSYKQENNSNMHRWYTAVLCSYLLLLVLPQCAQVQGQIIDKACRGTVGNFSYDLTKLATAITQDQTCLDNNQNTYFFLPCQVLKTSDCANTDPAPGACQKDTRRPPLFHDLGSVYTATFSQRPNAGPDQGFLLSYTGGEEGRRVDIEFICNTSVPGYGNLQCGNPVEQPARHYHLSWRTSYACPQGNNTSSEYECCLYMFSSAPNNTKVLCLDTNLGPSNCPTPLGKYVNIGKWPVDSCQDCFFKGKPNKHMEDNHNNNQLVTVTP